jgi:hypothetical protein
MWGNRVYIKGQPDQDHRTFRLALSFLSPCHRHLSRLHSHLPLGIAVFHCIAHYKVQLSASTSKILVHLPPQRLLMDKLLAPHTPEATAHNHLTYVLNSPPKPVQTTHVVDATLFFDATSRVISLRDLVSSENSFTWHTDHPSVDESLIAGCASYRAFDRYLSGNDLFLLPRTRTELESILYVTAALPSPPPRPNILHIRRRYAYDAIHNAIASSRSPLQTGGYSRVSFNYGTDCCYLY